MKIVKKLAYSFLAIIIIIIAIYSVAWVGCLNFIAGQVNKMYASKAISSNYSSGGAETVFNFYRITPTGFPFKIAFKITGWQEDSKSSNINYNSPIYVGYDMRAQTLFASYSGEISARYKPLVAGFGSQIKIGDSSITIRFPIKASVMKNIITNKNWFELINFIKTIQISAGNIEIFDLANGKKIYEKQHEQITVNFEKHKYYANWEDFLTHIPQSVSLYYRAKANSVAAGRPAPVGLIYGVWWPFSLDCEMRAYAKTTASSVKDLLGDLEIGISYLKTSNNIHSLLSNMLYKVKISGANNDISLKTNTHITLHKGFFASVFNFGGYLIPYLQSAYTANDPSKSKIIAPIIASMEDIIANKQRFNFPILEDKTFEIKADIHLAKRKGNLYSKINDFSLFSGSTGISFSNSSDAKLFSNWSAEGVAIISNYERLIEIMTDYFYQFSRFREFPEDIKTIHTEGTKSFLRTISDYPQSTSNNVTFEYSLNSKNLDNSKIGSVSLAKLKPLYYLSLYRKTIKNAKTPEDISRKMHYFFPDDKDEEIKFLQQLISKPLQVDDDAWQQLIK